MRVPVIARAIFVLLLALAARLFAQDVSGIDRWSVNVAEYNAHNVVIRRGETRILEPTFYQGMTVKSLSEAASVILYYKVSGMALPWSVTGSVYNATSGTVRVTWTPACESTQDVYQYEIAVTSSNAGMIRAFGSIVLKEGIGSSGTPLAPPGDATIDWSYVTNGAAVSTGDISSRDIWRVNVEDYTPRNIMIRAGETRILEVTHLQGSTAVDLSAATAVAFRYQTSGQTNYYYAAGDVLSATGGAVRVKLTPAHYAMADHYLYEIAVFSTNSALIRAFGLMDVFQGLAQIPAGLPVTGTSVDWLTITEHINLGSAPFPTVSWVQAYVAAHAGQATGLTWGALSGDITNQSDLVAYIASNAPAGPQGPQGPPGTNGVDGAQGPQGPPGTNGADGAQGPAGPAGTNGTNGADGTAATITISNVITLAAGQSAYVTNAGSSNSAALIFGIPAGSNGQDGAQGPPGTNGADGAAATIVVSNVVTLAAGQSAYVTNAGSSNAASLIFGIPSGSNAPSSSYVASSNLLGVTSANGNTTSITRLMGDSLYLAATTAVTITFDTTMTDTNGHSTIALSLWCSTNQITWHGGTIYTNTATLATNSWNALLLHRGFGQSNFWVTGKAW